jgi:hypothetical protein
LVHIREQHPQRRHQRPIWEITGDDGQLVGWVREHTVGRSSSIFYRAIGVHPTTREHVTLESSTDLQERIAKAIDFHRDPDGYRGLHWHPR